MKALKAATVRVMERQSAEDETFARIYQAYQAFFKDVSAYHALSEHTYYENRESGNE